MPTIYWYGFSREVEEELLAEFLSPLQLPESLLCSVNRSGTSFLLDSGKSRLGELLEEEDWGGRGDEGGKMLAWMSVRFWYSFVCMRAVFCE